MLKCFFEIGTDPTLFDGNVYACKCGISKLEILYFETGDLLRSIQNSEYLILEENEYIKAWRWNYQK